MTLVRAIVHLYYRLYYYIISVLSRRVGALQTSIIIIIICQLTARLLVFECLDTCVILSVSTLGLNDIIYVYWSAPRGAAVLGLSTDLWQGV